MIKRIKNSKALTFLAVFIVGLFLILVLRITYAYIANNFNVGIGNVGATSESVDEFKFLVGNPLNLDVTPTTLGEGGTDYSVTSTSQVTLKANATENKADYNYYLYLNITNNTFTYTTEDNKPEILLSITDYDNNPVTSIGDLPYKTYNGVSGFDVTTYQGAIPIALDQAISSTSSTEATIHNWTIKLTYLNLPSDQSANFGKKLSSSIEIRKDELVTTP